MYRGKNHFKLNLFMTCFLCVLVCYDIDSTVQKSRKYVYVMLPNARFKHLTLMRWDNLYCSYPSSCFRLKLVKIPDYEVTMFLFSLLSSMIRTELISFFIHNHYQCTSNVIATLLNLNWYKRLYQIVSGNLMQYVVWLEIKC